MMVGVMVERTPHPRHAIGVDQVTKQVNNKLENDLEKLRQAQTKIARAYGWGLAAFLGLLILASILYAVERAHGSLFQIVMDALSYGGFIFVMANFWRRSEETRMRKQQMDNALRMYQEKIDQVKETIKATGQAN